MSTNTTPLTLVGNGLSVLVAAVERARTGQHTTVIPTSGPWGAYFAGFWDGQERWDAGMVTYEFTSFQIPSDPPALASYNPMQRNDIGRFCAVVEAYAARLHGASPAPIVTPQLWDGERVHPDFLLANRLDLLQQLPARLKNSAIRELQACLHNTKARPFHPGSKGAWPLSGNGPDSSSGFLSYEQASRLNHGPTLHQALLEPFLNKVAPGQGRALAALYHRLAWLPLYWPETLLAALQGHTASLPPTVFSYPQGETIADGVARLANEALNNPHVRVMTATPVSVRASGAGFTLDLSDGQRLHTSRLAWGVSPESLLATLGLEPPADNAVDRLPISLCFLKVPHLSVVKSFSVLHTNDQESRVYRATHLSQCAQQSPDADGLVRLVLEANTDVLLRQGGDASDLFISDAVRTGVLQEGVSPSYCRVVHIPKALPLPTQRTIEQFLNCRARLLEALPNVDLLGPSAGPFTTSLSDQIVQGLQLCQRTD